MKQVLIGLVVIIMFSSCNPWIVSGGGCGVWHKKHFSGKAPKQRNYVRMPVIN